MTIVEMILLVIGVAFLAIAAYAVPLLIQLRKTALKAEEALGSINARLPVVMKNLEEITASTNKVVKTAEWQIDDLALTVEKINTAANFYLDREKDIREQMAVPFANAFRTYGAVIRGVRVFLESLKKG